MKPRKPIPNIFSPEVGRPRGFKKKPVSKRAVEFGVDRWNCSPLKSRDPFQHRMDTDLRRFEQPRVPPGMRSR